RMVALEADEVIAANNWGKAKMVSQSLAVLILLLGYTALGYWGMLLATALTLLSGWSYLKDAPRIIAATAGDRKA
ncbi:MAG: CDP-diacylglycerol--glycerol-3-phosphate 3-phosphatidyltransferase, partial [Actinomycetota bacterium]|nr:CDP-diacylglycerol--glycerol-3-phosphate 3-phosphatidyltransferase [Actinomycetota bacterium]